MRNKPRLAFYCQHLLGVGHLTRSFAIANGLVRDFDLVFIQGGPDIGRKPVDAIRLIELTPLQMRESDSSLYDPKNEISVEDVFQQRAKLLSEIAEEAFDFLVIELFPFGRKKFKAEILPFIQQMRDRNPNLKVICSLRDILVEKDDYKKRDPKIAQLVNEYFDFVFVHSDPKVLALDATFSEAAAIQSKTIYTGFVTEKRQSFPKAENSKQILVSQGGGVVGRELLEAFAALVEPMSDYQFLFSLGPNAPKDLRARLCEIAGNSTNYRVVDFLHNFEEELSRSCLSASLSGYNTVMNLLNCRIPALVYPYLANREQSLRAQAIAKYGYLSVLSSGDLRPEVLRSRVEFQLEKSYPESDLQITGVENTAELLKSMQKEVRDAELLPSL